MLFDACVTSKCDYGHEVLGFHQNPAKEKLHSKALRKITTFCGLRSEMSWPEPKNGTQTRMIRYYLHLTKVAK